MGEELIISQGHLTELQTQARPTTSRTTFPRMISLNISGISDLIPKHFEFGGVILLIGAN